MEIPWQKQCGKALTQAERTFLKDSANKIAQTFAKPTLVNIGVFRYASMYCLRVGAPNAYLVGIDIEVCPVPAHPDLNAVFIIRDSRICNQDFDSEIHLLFIDGDHHYATVKADIENWTPKVPIGGLAIFHDYSPLPRDLVKIPHLEGVKRAILEWQAQMDIWESIDAPDSLAAFRRIS